MIAEQIQNKEFLEESIKELKKENPAADIQLLEKTMGALFLVESLVSSGLKFVFKGGTSLVLLLREIKRFSVDVDIITEENPNDVIEKLKEIIGNQNLFTRLEENQRNNAVSKRMAIQHYKFFFNSVTDETEKYILLDVAYESNKYPKTIKKQIENIKLKIESNEEVDVPSIESILGDKLTVLATQTTGLSYKSGKELELMKQLYDVDKLFNEAENVSEIKESFINISTRELKYRKLSEITYDDVLDDIEAFTDNIIYANNQEIFQELSTGARKFNNFMLERKFLMDKEVVLAASKVKYLLHLIRNGNLGIERYQPDVTIEEKNVIVENKRKLKNIKKLNPEAYYYIMNSI